MAQPSLGRNRKARKRRSRTPAKGPRNANQELGNQKVSAEDIPVVAFSVGEEELSGIDTKPLVGHLAAWNYFMSIEDQEVLGAEILSDSGYRAG